MRWATVITDASFNNKDMSSGWAAWVRVDDLDHPIKHYSSFSKLKPKTSTEAEKMAAINGVWIANKYGADAVLIQSDCMAVIHMLNGTTRKRKLISQWNCWIEAAGVSDIRMIAKHVKGHTRTKDARSHVNRWCDKMANKARKS